MSTTTRASSPEHAVHIAQMWIKRVADEFDTQEREFAFGDRNAQWGLLPAEHVLKTQGELPAGVRALLTPGPADSGPA